MCVIYYDKPGPLGVASLCNPFNRELRSIKITYAPRRLRPRNTVCFTIFVVTGRWDAAVRIVSRAASCELRAPGRVPILPAARGPLPGRRRGRPGGRRRGASSATREVSGARRCHAPLAVPGGRPRRWNAMSNAGADCISYSRPQCEP